MNENLFDEKIKYVFERTEGSNHLIITFSSGAPNKSTNLHPYHYVKLAREFNCNRLFINDNLGKRGTYYLCEKMNFDVSETVCLLIKQICKDNMISYDNVFLLGSCKGGTAAIHIALKLNFGTVFAVLPQFRIGSYIDAYAKDVAVDMMGIYGAQEIKVLDEYIPNLLNNKKNTTIHVLVSENDADYEFQIKPIELLFKESKIENSFFFEKNNNIISHNDTFFNIGFFRKKLCETMLGVLYSETNNKFVLDKNKTFEYRLFARIIYPSYISTFPLDKRISVDLYNVKEIWLDLYDSVGESTIRIFNWLDNVLTPICYYENENYIFESKWNRTPMGDVRCFLEVFCNDTPVVLEALDDSRKFILNRRNDLKKVLYCWKSGEEILKKLIYRG